MTQPRLATRDDVIAFCCDRSFHQSLDLPHGAQGGSTAPLRISYGTTTNFADASLPAVFYCGPMGISRLLLVFLNHSALAAGVRIIFVDRPGFGGSTPVPLNQRLEVSLCAYEAVLEHLKPGPVALLSHSAGTVYLHNMLARFPHLLHPTKPVAVALAPWVRPKYSGSKLLGAAELLPQSWTRSLGTINNLVASSIGFSAGILSSFGSAQSDASNTEADDKCIKAYGVNKTTFKILEQTVKKYLQAEPTGVGEDAAFCLKKNGLSWNACDELPPYLVKLAASHAQDASQSTTSSSTATGRRLTFRAVFAQDDVTTGKGGQDYYRQCWSDPSLQSGIAFDCTTVPDSNHDSVALPELGQIQKELAFIKSHMVPSNDSD